MRHVLCALAIVGVSACAHEYAPSPSGVGGPDPSLSGPVRSGSAAKQQENCTLTQGFWKNHGDVWPVEELILGGVTYTKAELLVILRTPPRGDATYVLIHQLIAASLNVAAGSDPTEIADTLVEADAWLAANPLGSDPGRPERDIGLALAALLDDYNNGETGPGHCDTAPPASPTPPPG
jgi:hypothetical protein